MQLLRLHGWDYTIEASVLEVYSCPPHSPRPTLNRTPLPHLRQDWARPYHIGTGTRLTPCHIRTGAHPVPHLRRDWAHPLPHLHRDWDHPLPHLHRGGLGSPRRIGTGIGLHRYNETLRDLLSPDASLSMKLDTEAKVEVR